MPLLLSILLLTFSTLASAQTPEPEETSLPLPKFQIEFRTDLELRNNTSKRDLNRGRPRLLFEVARIHLNIEGTVDEQTSYHVRVHWEADNEYNADNTRDAAEYWYLSHQYSSKIRIQVGKQFIHQGGLENSYNPIKNYGYSLIGERTHNFFEVGASVFYDLSDKDQDSLLVAQVFNELEGGSEQQQLLGYNVAWYGDTWDNLFETVIQYGWFPHHEKRVLNPETNKTEAVPGTKEFLETFLSIGLHTQVHHTIFEFDWLTQTEDIQNVAHTTFIGLLKQKQTNLHPFLRLSHDSSFRNTPTVVKGTDNMTELQVGSEYFPKKHERYQYHLVFAYRNTNTDEEHIMEYRFNTGVSVQF